MAKLSVVIATKNEEKNIENCLNSVKWADEIIVVDMNSADKTRDIAKKYTDKIYLSDGGTEKFVLHNKNLGMKKATKEWILLIDADECVTPELRNEIEKKIDEESYDGFELYFKTYFLGIALKTKYLNNFGAIRLFKKKFSPFYSDKTHHQKQKFVGRKGKFKNPILHFWCNDLHKLIDKTNLYTSQDSTYFYNNNLKKGYFNLLIKPILIFIYIFFVKKAYKDKTRGFVLSSVFAFCQFLESAKAWEIHYKKSCNELEKVYKPASGK